MANIARLAQTIAKIPVVDNHCHSLLRNLLQLTAAEFRGCFSETTEAEQRDRHLASALTYRLALQELGRLFACPADESAILEQRGRADLSGHVQRLVQDGGIRGLLVDTGFRRDTSFDVAELRR